MKKVKWYQYIIRFFFTPCCSNCTNLAHRYERNAGQWKNKCLNHLTIRSSVSIPINKVPYNGWDYDPKYNSIFQRLWVMFKWKEKGKPVKINRH